MKTQKKKSNMILYIFLFIFLIFSFFILMQSSIFEIDRININGNKNISSEKIRQITGIREGMNIFSFSMKNTKEKALSFHKVQSISIKRKLPNELSIEIKEKVPIGYIFYMGTYLYIDQYGQIIDTKNTIEEQKILIDGVDMKHFSLGEKVSLKQEELNTIETISDLVIKYNMQDLGIVLNIKNRLDLKMQIGKINILLGNLDDIDYKIRNVKEAMKVLSKGYEGIYDIRNPQKYNPIFRPLV